MWQYITLMKRIYLIDCPGVVPPNAGDTEEDILLRGVVRVENVENPSQYIAAVLRRCQAKHIERTYDVKQSEYNDDPIEFLTILARKGGRLLKGGEADVDGVAKMVLNDFLRGKIPWFTRPPKKEGVADQEAPVVEGRKGALGEMPGDGKVAPAMAEELEKAVLEQEAFDGFDENDVKDIEDADGTNDSDDSDDADDDDEDNDDEAEATASSSVEEAHEAEGGARVV